MKLAKKLKQLRQQKHHTQKQFAKFLGIGHATYQKYEIGCVNPRFELLKKICAKFPEQTLWLIIDDITIEQSMPTVAESKKRRTKVKTQ